MPDLDILRRGISPCFRQSYRLIRGRADNELVLASCRRGLALALQLGSGVPSLRARAALIASASRGGASGRAAVAGSRDLLLADQGSRHGHIAHRALQRSLADGHTPTSAVESEHVLARYVCLELLDHHLLSGLSAESPEIGMSSDDFAAYRSRLHRDLDVTIDLLAAQLVADPTGATVHTPPSRRRRRPSTRDMLAEVVG